MSKTEIIKEVAAKQGRKVIEKPVVEFAVSPQVITDFVNDITALGLVSTGPIRRLK